MPEYTPELRAEVDAAMAAATEGGWHRTSFSSVVGCVITSQPDPKRNTVTLAGVHGAFGDDYRGEVIANANAIVALHNAYPALTAHIDAQAERIAELERVLREINVAARVSEALSDDGDGEPWKMIADKSAAALKDTAQ